MSVVHKLTPAVFATFVLACSAHAQSSFSLYGSVDLALGSFQKSAKPAEKHLTKVDGNSMVTSYLGFKGAEDIGDGLKAGFAVETFLRPDTGGQGRSDTDVFWGRNANLWLQGGFGKVTVGRQASLGFLHAAAFNPFGGAFGVAPAIRLTYGAPWGNDKGDSAWSNAIGYASPVFNGITASVQVAPGEAADKSERTSLGGALNYTAGPLSLGFVTHSLRSAEAPKANLTAGQKQNFNMASASYDAGVAKFFAQYGRYDNAGFAAAKDKIDTSLVQVGAAVPVTAVSKVLWSYGQSKEKAISGATLPDVKHTIVSMAYDHWLSKRTDVYAAFLFDNEDQAGFSSGKTYMVGVRHAF